MTDQKNTIEGCLGKMLPGDPRPDSLGLARVLCPPLSLNLTGGSSNLGFFLAAAAAAGAACLFFAYLLFLSPKKVSRIIRVVSLILCHSPSIQAVSNLNELFAQSNGLLTLLQLS